MIVKVKPLVQDLSADAAFTFASVGAAAFDVKAYIPNPGPLVLEPGHTAMVRTGYAVWIDDPGYALMLLPRSGLGSRGLVLANSTGLIDSDYQGELMVSLLNRGHETFIIYSGDRIAQGLFVPVVRPTFQIVEEFEQKTQRGAGGFGSTGVSYYPAGSGLSCDPVRGGAQCIV